MSQPTVRAYRYATRENILVLEWTAEVDPMDVHPAFQELMQHLKTSDTPQWVIVNILENRNMPVSHTISNALVAHRHKMLREWLVVGENLMARSVSQVLMRLTRRNNIHWFTDVEEALDYTTNAPVNAVVSDTEND